MLNNLIVPFLCSILIYWYLPAPETNLVGNDSTKFFIKLTFYFSVVFQSKKEILQSKDLAKIGSIK